MDPLDFYTVRLPDPQDLTHAAVLDFRHHLREYELATLADDDSAAATSLVSACAAVYPGPHSELANLPIAAAEGTATATLLGFAISFADLCGIAESFVTATSQGQPVSWVAPDGNTYLCDPAGWVTYLFGRPPLTVAESVECLTLEGARRTIEEQADRTSRLSALNASFTLTVKELAILMRKPNESLPLGEAERDAWLKERVPKFAEVPHRVALEVLGGLRDFTKRAWRPIRAQAYSLSASTGRPSRKPNQPPTTGTAAVAVP